MMSHDTALAELAAHLQPVMEESPDGVYIWLDEAPMACNQQFADLFGYTVEDVAKQGSFLSTFIEPEDREAYALHYQNRVAAVSFPVTFRFRGLHQNGSSFVAETDMIPLSYGGHIFAYHFVRKVGT